MRYHSCQSLPDSLPSKHGLNYRHLFQRCQPASEIKINDGLLLEVLNVVYFNFVRAPTGSLRVCDPGLCYERLPDVFTRSFYRAAGLIPIDVAFSVLMPFLEATINGPSFVRPPLLTLPHGPFPNSVQLLAVHDHKWNKLSHHYNINGPSAL